MLVVVPVLMDVFATAAGLVAVVAAVVAYVVGEGVVEEPLGEEGDLVASVALLVGVQMVVHLCHPRQPTLGHSS